MKTHKNLYFFNNNFNFTTGNMYPKLEETVSTGYLGKWWEDAIKIKSHKQVLF